MQKSDPEYKVYIDRIDKSVDYFIDRFKFIADELVYEVFSQLNNRIDECVNVLSRNMLDFCEIIKFFANSLKQVNPSTSL